MVKSFSTFCYCCCLKGGSRTNLYKFLNAYSKTATIFAQCNLPSFFIIVMKCVKPEQLPLILFYSS